MYPSDDDGCVRAEPIQQAARSHVQRAIVTPAEIELCPELAQLRHSVSFLQCREMLGNQSRQLDPMPRDAGERLIGPGAWAAVIPAKAGTSGKSPRGPRFRGDDRCFAGMAEGRG